LAPVSIAVEEELVDRAMRRYRLASRQAAVELALRRLVGDMPHEAPGMEGIGWEGDFGEMRSPEQVTDL
jgi:Arc/MetJ family transcription regulator